MLQNTAAAAGIPGAAAGRRLRGMGRTGRYTLSIMVWVAAFAAWSGVVGLVVGAVSDDTAGATTPSGIGALLYVVLPAVPTIVALWFNDWARDGFPSAQERRRGDYRRADRGLRDLPAANPPTASPPANQPAEASAPAAAAGQPPSEAR